MKPLDTTQESEDALLLMRYLLDDLSEGEQEKVEERYSSDESFYSKLLATEDELIDSYVLGDISHQNRVKFEQVYLTNPHRREKVESNRVLLEAVNNMLHRPPFYRRFWASLRRTLSPPNLNLGYSFAGLLLVAIPTGLLCWSIWERGRLRNELAQTRSQLVQKENEYQQTKAALEQSHINLQPSPGLPDNQQVVTGGPQKEVVTPHRREPIVSFALLRGGMIRGGQASAPEPLVIQRGVLLVKLTVDLVPNDYPDYRVFLKRVGGEEVWDGTVWPSRPGVTTKKIVINLPASLFQHRDYILKVTSSDSPDNILGYHHMIVINENVALERAPDGKAGETRREK